MAEIKMSGLNYQLKCQVCGHEGTPLLKRDGLTQEGWILFGVLLLACFPLCWLPFVIDKFKKEVRICSKCHTSFPS